METNSWSIMQNHVTSLCLNGYKTEYKNVYMLGCTYLLLYLKIFGDKDENCCKSQGGICMRRQYKTLCDSHPKHNNLFLEHVLANDDLQTKRISIIFSQSFKEIGRFYYFFLNFFFLHFYYITDTHNTKVFMISKLKKNKHNSMSSACFVSQAWYCLWTHLFVLEV